MSCQSPALGGGGHRRDHSKDSLQNLLKETQDLGRGSDTTSGCESGHSSDLGAREGEELEEEVGPLLPDYLPPAPATWLGPGSPGYSHCVEAPPSTLPASYTKVGSLRDPPGYVNQVPPIPAPPSSVYSSPPALPTPVTLNPTAPPLQVGFPASSNLVPTTGPPAASQGYVTFNSVKSTGTTEAASPGYIPLSQLSPSKEVVESKENGNLSPSSLPPGYSRVGLNSTSPGYVAWDS